MAIKEKPWTYQDYLQLGDEKRYEIIEGELLEMPAPSIRHQKVLWNLTGLFRDYHTKTKSGLFLFAPVDVVLSETEVVQPDLIYISEDRLSIVKERAVEGVPDMV
ncbi:MAG: Uma2 family endonuclease, partial [Aquificota bacterium]